MVVLFSEGIDEQSDRDLVANESNENARFRRLLRFLWKIAGE